MLLKHGFGYDPEDIITDADIDEQNCIIHESQIDGADEGCTHWNIHKIEGVVCCGGCGKTWDSLQKWEKEYKGR